MMLVITGYFNPPQVLDSGVVLTAGKLIRIPTRIPWCNIVCSDSFDYLCI